MANMLFNGLVSLFGRSSRKANEADMLTYAKLSMLMIGNMLFITCLTTRAKVLKRGYINNDSSDLNSRTMA